MTTDAKNTEETVEEARNPFLAAVRRVLLASIGAVALAQDEIEDFVQKLVERGEIAEKEGKTLVSDLMEKRKRQAEKAEVEMDDRIEGLLSRMNVPSKNDIEDLSAKITELTDKVDELNK